MTGIPLKSIGKTIHFDSGDERPKIAHVFERDAVLAINTALACRRPLLVKGDPGVGKSQLAQAAAHVLRRKFLTKYIDARTEPRDLLWSHDAVGRLADAQVYKGKLGAAKKVLAQGNYVRPEPLWWALDWGSAWVQAKRALPKGELPDRDAPDGVVLLLDEIDKADSSVPNGLLECLGQQRFSVPGVDKPIVGREPAPLVLLTTNGDRLLPAAFVRRCVVLHLRVPEGDELTTWLVARGKAHFGKRLKEDVLVRAAEKLADDRRRSSGCKPGLAEYIDLLTAIHAGVGASLPDPIATLSTFVFNKHRDPGEAS